MTSVQGAATTTAMDEPPLLVHAYLDGELDPANSLAIAQQIAADPALAVEVERIQVLRQVVRERLPREPVPHRLRSRIEAAIGRRGPQGHPSWRALAASVVFAMALASGSTWVVLRPVSRDHIAEAVVDSHMRALMAPQATDVTSSERHSVKPWFGGRIPQSPQVVDLAKEGFPLVGGRIDVIGTTPVATLVYGRRLHLISLSAMPAASSPQALSPRKSIKGYNLVQWSDDGIDYWAASDLNAAELQAFARLFRGGVSGL
jgi:anti-sigma factor RsiW